MRGDSGADSGGGDKPTGQAAKNITESLMREWNV